MSKTVSTNERAQYEKYCARSESKPETGHAKLLRLPANTLLIHSEVLTFCFPAFLDALVLLKERNVVPASNRDLTLDLLILGATTFLVLRNFLAPLAFSRLLRLAADCAAVRGLLIVASIQVVAQRIIDDRKVVSSLFVRYRTHKFFGLS